MRKQRENELKKLKKKASETNNDGNHLYLNLKNRLYNFKSYF